jgi:hypothetical protein
MVQVVLDIVPLGLTVGATGIFEGDGNAHLQAELLQDLLRGTGHIDEGIAGIEEDGIHLGCAVPREGGSRSGHSYLARGWAVS